MWLWRFGEVCGGVSEHKTAPRESLRTPVTRRPDRVSVQLRRWARHDVLLSGLFTDDSSAVPEGMKGRYGAIASMTEVKWQNITSETTPEPRKRCYRRNNRSDFYLSLLFHVDISMTSTYILLNFTLGGNFHEERGS